uniref:Pur_ac_phosph_N domain-containing protein n=1 Tax=Heterorhabditis bacteriophora TaxID=37862 RepID=A0A1I7XLJ7_HETBA
MFLPQVPTLRFCILVNALCSLGSAVPYPEQVHLSFMGNNSVMAVSWITFEYDSTTVKYGPKSTNITFTAEDSVTEWTFGGITRYSHRAVMRELKPETEYYYQIGSRSFTFRTLAMNSQSYKVCIFGDLGYWHGNSTASIIKNGLAGKYDFIIHVGKYFQEA